MLVHPGVEGLAVAAQHLDGQDLVHVVAVGDQQQPDHGTAKAEGNAKRKSDLSILGLQIPQVVSMTYENNNSSGKNSQCCHC